MLSNHSSIQRDLLEMIAFDPLVPPNHLVRKMEATLDFSFIYELVEDRYATVGRPSMDSVLLVKRTFIQYTYVEEAHHLRHKQNSKKCMPNERND